MNRLQNYIEARSIPEPNSGCWLWEGPLYKNRYGLASLANHSRYAHRLSYEAYFGSPGTKFVCHRCDNPSCVNPSHLFLGTAADNTADMIQKGRARYPSQVGVSNANSRLTEKQVREIRAQVASGRLLRLVAKDFGVSRSHVGNISRMRAWRTA